jgi:hypothetical protein
MPPGAWVYGVTDNEDSGGPIYRGDVLYGILSRGRWREVRRNEQLRPNAMQFDLPRAWLTWASDPVNMGFGSSQEAYRRLLSEAFARTDSKTYRQQGGSRTNVSIRDFIFNSMKARRRDLTPIINRVAKCSCSS